MARRRREQPQGQALVASAEQIKITSDGRSNLKPQSMWQGEAWNHYHSVPEIWFAVNYIGNAMRRIRLFAATQPDPMKPPVPLEGAVAKQAQAELNRLRDADGTHGEIIHNMAMQLSVPGEGLFAMWTDPEDGEKVGVYSMTELVRKNDQRWWFVDEDGKSEEVPGKVNPLRFWRPDPRFHKRPDSPMRALAPLLRELTTLDQMYRSNARSRIPAGLLLVPQEVNFRGDQRVGMDSGFGQGPAKDPFVGAVMNSLVTPITDEESAGNVAPGIIKVDSRFISTFRHLTFDRSFDEATANRYNKVLQRVAIGLDIPNQVVTGMDSLNHWSAWLVDDDAFDSHLAPLMQLITTSLTQIFLRPALEATVGEEKAKDVIVWFDPSALISHPNKAADADHALDRAAISWTAYRRYKGYTEHDAPDEAEIEERMRFAPPAGVAPKAGAGGDGGDNGQAPPLLPDSEQENENKPHQAPDKDKSQAEGKPTSQGVRADASPFLVAGGGARRTKPIGRILVDAERSLRTSIQADIDQILNERLAVTADASDDHRDAAAAAGLVFLSRTKAQQQILLDLADDYGADDVDIAEWEAEMEEDRDRGQVILIAGILTYIAGEIFDHSHNAPLLGEVSEFRTPTRIVRDALTVAGGADTPGAFHDATGQPQGGAMTGATARDILDTVGLPPTNYRWVYGDAMRKCPFESHEELDGSEFIDWQDEVLAVRAEDAWLEEDWYYPGDHDGCQCDFEPVVSEQSD